MREGTAEKDFDCNNETLLVRCTHSQVATNSTEILGLLLGLDLDWKSGVGAFDDAALRKQTEELQRHPERSCPTCAQSATEHQARDAPAVLLTRGARPVHVVLCEGLIVMHPDFQLSDSFDLCINLDLPQDTARARRKCRDYGEHPDPADYFDSVVWPRYIDYHKIIAEHPGLLSFHGDAPREQIVDAVIDEIKKIV
ncbi:hypothetical protein, variant 2 [Capsaspora owczarzaki ATCC 30864]|uniref:Phosphoribulokinase/uridine kinase domain-containing protein n=1 Tax=Capsaspora owczarzaki (strain ATCC 30864) TaxID=595528 RepID=A0A0D2VTT8_CAPO3|nr:hypothetical protein, variant 2 [Capsaspora owczarzaki ATCC 30864]